jgi:WD40 repeat protein
MDLYNKNSVCKLASAGAIDQLCIIWDLEKQEPLINFKQHNATTSISWINENTIITGTWDNTVKVWDLRE